MRVLCQVRDVVAAAITQAAPGIDLVPVPREGEPPPGLDGDVLLTYPWGSANLTRLLARGVRWIHVLGTGVDAFPLHLVRGQLVTCSRGASAVPISEWVLAAMLAFAKRLPEAWMRSPPVLPRRDAGLGTLHGKTLGIVGFGAIGAAVAARALPFGMRVRAVRRTTAPAGLAGVEIVGSLPELVAAADHVVIAAPATPATRHLFDRALFAAVGPGAHLVNVARGALVDLDALREALDDGRVALASLDAVEPEPLPEGHWAYGHPRVRLSPHVSWQAEDAIAMLIRPFVENLRRYRAGERLHGVVDVEAGY